MEKEGIIEKGELGEQAEKRGAEGKFKNVFYIDIPYPKIILPLYLRSDIKLMFSYF